MELGALNGAMMSSVVPLLIVELQRIFVEVEPDAAHDPIVGDIVVATPRTLKDRSLVVREPS